MGATVCRTGMPRTAKRSAMFESVDLFGTLRSSIGGQAMSPQPMTETIKIPEVKQGLNKLVNRVYR